MIAIDESVMREAVTRAVGEVMEAMFFEAVEPALSGLCMEGCNPVTAHLRFWDAVEGEFMLAVPLETAVSLAGNFMALDPGEVDRSHAEATICELANIICGSALSRLEPSSALRLSSPEVTRYSCVPTENVFYQHYRLIEGCLAISIRIV